MIYWIDERNRDKHKLSEEERRLPDSVEDQGEQKELDMQHHIIHMVNPANL